MIDDDVLVALIGAAALVLAAWIKGRFEAWQAKRQLERIQADVTAALHQVQNSHGSNLRDDIDHLAEDIDNLTGEVGRTRADVRDVRTDLAGVHIDITDIRATDRAARTEHAELWAAIHQGGHDA